MSVTLREKPINEDTLSLYLDFYPPIANPLTGAQTRRNFLKLYLHSETVYQWEEYADEKGKPKRRLNPVLQKDLKPKTRRLTELERTHNKQTRQLAESIAAQRQLDVQAGRYGFLIKKPSTDPDFLEYFRQAAEANLATGTTKDGGKTLRDCYRHFEVFTGGTCMVGDVTPEFCVAFKKYLASCPRVHTSKKRTVDAAKKLSPNSASIYYATFKRLIRRAIEEKVLPESVDDNLGSLRLVEVEREYLIEEELKVLVRAECKRPSLKRAALFSVLTGLRYSDIEKLLWEEVRYSEAEGYYVRFHTRKGGRPATLPISEQAYSLLSNQGEISGRVFPDLKYGNAQNQLLRRWFEAAGITRHITFHAFRHTFATLQISKDTDLYIISKLLGHQKLTTTQIYARIIDQKKREAVDRIKLDL